ncbi:hypothetical protein ACHQM5_006578 [Ranunculus cassubicifolius]
MSTHILPTTTCDNIKKCERDFWWNGSTQSKSIHTTKWPNMLKPKTLGGLGFRDIKQMNYALMGKF